MDAMIDQTMNVAGLDEPAVTAYFAALEEARFAAMRALDVAALRALLADDLVYTHSSGVRDGKESYIQALQDGTYRYFAMQATPPSVRVYGDTALVVGRVVTRLASRGAEKLLDNATLTVWVRRDGRWQLVAYQPTVVPTAAPKP
jgi:uncharacterized protein (TIGR02246 family)